MKDIKLHPVGQKPTERQRIAKKILWLISTARNAIIVIVCSTIAYKMESKSGSPLVLTGPVRSGLPDFGPPPFTTQVFIKNKNLKRGISSKIFLYGFRSTTVP